MLLEVLLDHLCRVAGPIEEVLHLQHAGRQLAGARHLEDAACNVGNVVHDPDGAGRLLPHGHPVALLNRAGVTGPQGKLAVLAALLLEIELRVRVGRHRRGGNRRRGSS